MRKLFVSVFTLMVSLQSFASDKGWISFGAEFGNSWEHAESVLVEADSYIGSRGFFISTFDFYNGKNVGLFLHDAFLFPSKMTVTINGGKNTVNLDAFKSTTNINMCVGVGFRTGVSEKVDVYIGIGPSINYFLFSSNLQTVHVINFGLGSDLGIKFDFSEYFFLCSGGVFGYDAAGWTITKTAYGTDAVWSDSGYWMISVRPYIGIGALIKDKRL